MLARGCDTLHILGAGPSGTPGDGEPDIVLRPRRPDAPVAPVRGEVALDELGADDDHGSSNEPRRRRRQAYPTPRKPAMKMAIMRDPLNGRRAAMWLQ